MKLSRGVKAVNCAYDVEREWEREERGQKRTFGLERFEPLW
jgi:hypothetical protein